MRGARARLTFGLVAVAAIASCGRETVTALDLKINPTGFVDQIKTTSVMLAGMPLDVRRSADGLPDAGAPADEQRRAHALVCRQRRQQDGDGDRARLLVRQRAGRNRHHAIAALEEGEHGHRDDQHHGLGRFELRRHRKWRARRCWRERRRGWQQRRGGLDGRKRWRRRQRGGGSRRKHGGDRRRREPARREAADAAEVRAAPARPADRPARREAADAAAPRERAAPRAPPDAAARGGSAGTGGAGRGRRAWRRGGNRRRRTRRRGGDRGQRGKRWNRRHLRAAGRPAGAGRADERSFKGRSVQLRLPRTGAVLARGDA